MQRVRERVDAQELDHARARPEGRFEPGHLVRVSQLHQHEPVAQVRGHLLGLDGMYGATHQRVVERRQMPLSALLDADFFEFISLRGHDLRDRPRRMIAALSRSQR
jgi:hypothetical protein